MKKTGYSLLLAGIVALLLFGLLTAAGATIGHYSRTAEITYAGVGNDRGFGVNSNPNSPYYGYLYVCDGTGGTRLVRILRPEPVASGVAATSYVEVGTLSYPTTPLNNLINQAFVTPDDKVWAVDYSGKTIVVGEPAGGNWTVLPITTVANPRGLWVVGNYGQIGTKVYIAEATFGGATRCEIFEYKASGWTRVFDLGGGNLQGLANPYSVAVDAAGNSYWLSCNTGQGLSGFKYMVKVKPDYTIDSAFTLQIPDGFLKDSTGLTYNLLPTSVVYAADPYDQDNSQYIAVSFAGAGSYPHGNCVLRFRTDGTYIDGLGMGYWMPDFGTGLSSMYNSATSPSYSPMELWDPPTGNRNTYMAVDDKHNFYVLTAPQSAQDTLNPCVAKFHRLIQSAPQPATNPAASHDIYGQVKLSWTASSPTLKGVMPSDQVGAATYNIYRSTNTTKPATVYASVPDGGTKWKDSAQGQTPGGPFYYWVTAANAMGESTPVGPIGPIAPAASTAPAARSLGVALSYSELSKADTVNVGGYDSMYNQTKAFLDARKVSYTTIWDADAAHANVESDNLAGHSLFILEANLEMTSYEAQCIRDYIKYSGGRIFSGYWNATAYADQVNMPEFILSDVYRVKNLGWQGDSLGTYRYLKAVDGAPGASVIFEGLPTGVYQSGSSTITMAVDPFTDGSAVVAGQWYDAGGNPVPNGAGLVVGYQGGQPVSVYTGLLWWYRTPESVRGGSISASKLLENVLKFFGVAVQPASGLSLGGSQLNNGDGSPVGYEGLVVTEQLLDVNKNALFVYLENRERTAGIKVTVTTADWLLDYQPGTVVSVSGALRSESEAYAGGTTWGDRYLEPTEFWVTATGGAPLAPVYIRTNAVVGPWAGGGNQQGANYGGGVNNMSLYAKVSGKVTYADLSGGIQCFYVDDGAGLKDGSTHLDGGSSVPNVGVRVVCPNWQENSVPTGFAVGKHVSVSGPTSLDLIGIGGDNGVPCIRIADTLSQIKVY